MHIYFPNNYILQINNKNKSNQRQLKHYGCSHTDLCFKNQTRDLFTVCILRVQHTDCEGMILFTKELLINPGFVEKSHLLEQLVE